MRSHFHSWCISGSITGSLRSAYSFLSLHCKPCFCSHLHHRGLDAHSIYIQYQISVNDNPQREQSAIEHSAFSILPSYSKLPGEQTGQLSDILYHLLACGHLRHLAYQDPLFAMYSYGEPGVYTLPKCTISSLLLFGSRYKNLLPFSFLCKVSLSLVSLHFGV